MCNCLLKDSTMAMTKITDNDYGFYDAYINDMQPVIVNNTARTLKKAELVLIDDMFGNVVNVSGISPSSKGLIDIHSDRIVHTKQILNGSVFSVGDIIYAIVQTDVSQLLLTNSSVGNIAVGRVTDVASDMSYVEFRPYVQNIGA